MPILDPGRDVDRIEVVSEVLRRGRQMGYSRSRIVDADEPTRVLALTEGQGISIGTPRRGSTRCRSTRSRWSTGPTFHRCGRCSAGTGDPTAGGPCPSSRTTVASPDAALHLGPQFVILETAAMDLAAGVAGTDRLEGVSSHVMFLARGKVGPFRVEGEAGGGSGRHGRGADPAP